MLAALHSYIHTTWLRFWGYIHITWLRLWASGVTCGFEMMSFYVMIEVERLLKLIHAFILDIYKVFEHTAILSIDIW